MIYETLPHIQELAPDTIVVRHEDLSRDPWGQFYALHEKLGISVNGPTNRALQFFCNSLNPAETSIEPPHTVALNSQANLDNWKKRLDPEEIRRIHRLTSQVALRYYTSEELEDFETRLVPLGTPSPDAPWLERAASRLTGWFQRRVGHAPPLPRRAPSPASFSHRAA